jgi:hypothetical protein
MVGSLYYKALFVVRRTTRFTWALVGVACLRGFGACVTVGLGCILKCYKKQVQVHLQWKRRQDASASLTYTIRELHTVVMLMLNEKVLLEE